MSAGIPSGKHWHKKKHSQDGNFVLFKKKKKAQKKVNTNTAQSLPKNRNTGNNSLNHSKRPVITVILKSNRYITVKKN